VKRSKPDIGDLVRTRTGHLRSSAVRPARWWNGVALVIDKHSIDVLVMAGDGSLIWVRRDGLEILG